MTPAARSALACAEAYMRAGLADDARATLEPLGDLAQPIRAALKAKGCTAGLAALRDVLEAVEPAP